MVTNLAMFVNESSFELYGCLLTNRCLVMSGSTLPIILKKKKKKQLHVFLILVVSPII